MHVRRRLPRLRLLALCLFTFVVMGQPGAGEPASELIKSFGNPNRMGMMPSGKLTAGTDGYLYGTTLGLDQSPSFPYFSNNDGTIYRLKPDGTEYEVVHRFERTKGLAKPRGHLLEASDGFLYGTTTVGTEAGRGAVYKFDRTTRAITILKQLETEGDQDITPFAGLTEGSDGTLYGTARGTNAQRSILFKLNRDGTNYQVIHVLPNFDEHRSICEAPLLMGSGGSLYGTCVSGGQNSTGYAFRVAVDGSDFEVLRHFRSTAGAPAFPAGGLIEGNDGLLYGLLGSGVGEGSGAGGAVYSINRSGAGFRVVRTFRISDGVWRPRGELLEGADGRLLGALGGGSSPSMGGHFAINKDGSGFTSTANTSLPASPATGIIQTPDGWSHGVALYATGTENAYLYRIAPAGGDLVETLRFSGTGHEVSSPMRLVEGADGWLYSLNRGTPDNSLVLCKIKPDGTGLAELSHWNAGGDIDVIIGSSFVAGPDGYLYAPASAGGAAPHEGIVRLSNDTGEIMAWVITFSSAQGDPAALRGIHASADGYIYGVSEEGGSDNLGTIYRVALDGSGFVVLRHFTLENAALGARPRGGLIETESGKLCGIISEGIFSMNKDGSNYIFTPLPADMGNIFGELLDGGDGNIFGLSRAPTMNPADLLYRFEPNGAVFTVIHAFEFVFGTKLAPGFPLAHKDGYIYGVTDNGNDPGEGYLYRIRNTGVAFEVLHEFRGRARDGFRPLNGVFLGADGAIYGSFSSGGEYGFGALFRYGEMIPPDPRLTVTTREGETIGNGGFINLGEFDNITESSSITLILRNDGGQPMTLASFQVEEPDSEFLVIPPTAMTLAPGESGSVEIRFRIYRTGTNTATVRWQTNDPAAASFVVNVRATVMAPVFMIFDGTGDDAPEIVVPENPLEMEEMDLGVARRGASLGREFRVTNAGTRDLVLSAPQATGYHPIVSALPLSIPPGGSTVMRVQRDTSLIGRLSDRTTIQTNDHLQRVPFLRFVSTVVDPEISVQHLAEPDPVSLVDGQSTPVAFGEARLTQPRVVNFSILNEGTAPLMIYDLRVPAGYAGLEILTLPMVLETGASLPLRLQLTASALGNFSGTVEIRSDDFDEPNFRFPVTGLVTAPEIAVHDGDTSASAELKAGQSAPVDFGRNIQGTPGERFFTIANNGTAPLALESIAVPPGYVLANAPALPATIALGSSARWRVSLVTTVVGVHSGSVVITSDDPTDPVFRFPVTGEVFIPPPVASFPNSEDGTHSTLNRQTGLREQTIRLANDTTATVPGYRLLIRGLPTEVIVANASEKYDDGTVVVLVRQSLSPFSSMNLILEYASSDRRALTMAPEVSVEVVLDLPDDTVTDDTGTFLIDRVAWLAEAGGLMIEFSSEPGRLYEVQYSDDGVGWKTSPTHVRAAGNRTQWIDRGPPHTTAPPTSQSLRFYRVRELIE